MKGKEMRRMSGVILGTIVLASMVSGKDTSVTSATGSWLDSSKWSNGVAIGGDTIRSHYNMYWDFRGKYGNDIDTEGTYYNANSNTAYISINSLDTSRTGTTVNLTGNTNYTRGSAEYNTTIVVENNMTRAGSGAFTWRDTSSIYRTSLWVKGELTYDNESNVTTPIFQFGGPATQALSGAGLKTVVLNTIALSTNSSEYTVRDAIVSFNRVGTALVTGFVKFGGEVGVAKTTNAYMYLNNSTIALGEGETCKQVVSVGGLKTVDSTTNSVIKLTSGAATTGYSAELVIIGTRNGEGVADRNEFRGTITDAVSVTMDGRILTPSAGASTEYVLTVTDGGLADGYQALRGTNTYTGVTTIKNGTLMLTGTAGSKLGRVSLDGSGAKFGAIGGEVDIGNIETSELLLNKGALLFDLGNAGASDKIYADIITKGSDFATIDFIFTGGKSGDKYSIIYISDISGSDFDISDDANDYFKSLSGGNFAWESGIGNQAVLTYTIPEPSEIALLLGLLGLGFVIYRKRSRK